MQCVAPDINGVIRIVSDATATCQNYLVQNTDTGFTGVFDPNWVLDNGGVDVLWLPYWLGFSLPIIAFLCAWGWAQLISMFNDDSGF